MSRDDIRRLTSLSSCAGWASKLGQADLAQVLRGLTNLPNPDLLIGSATSDDAAVFQLTPDLALVQTLDFFTPIVDDPFLFGQIAAANSLSDIYAMGGRPFSAMNIVGLPTDLVPLETLNLILQGGAEKIRESGAVLAGGHTVKNPELFYGLSVSGKVHPQKIISNAQGKPGDLLLLTKPLGTGIISTALKRGLAPEPLAQKAATLMATLNLPGAVLAEAGLTHAGTDVTGFGLLGHLSNLCRGSNLTAQIDSSKIPAIDPAVLTLIADDCVPGGTRANLTHASTFTHFAPSVPETLRLLLADAQTSGGMLFAISPENLDQALSLLQSPIATLIGQLLPQTSHLIEVS